jgi:Flp pilus assembly protein TadG
MRLLQRFLKSEEGNVLIITGASLLMLMGVSGAGIDLGRQQLVRSKIQQASDAASIAAAGLPESATDAQRVAAGQRYFALNFPDDYMGVSRPVPNVSISASGISVSATAQLPTRFISFIGIDKVQSVGRSVVSATTASTGASTYDLILSMDVSGSMSISDPPAGRRIDELRTAANTISSSLLGNNTTNSRIAANTWTSRLVESIGFQSSYPPMQSFLRDMRASGGTCSAVGMQQARVQATAFRNDVVRVIILLTDGVNGCPNSDTISICNQFKNSGVVVYTIALGRDVQDNDGVRNFLASCASGTPEDNLNQYFFIAPNGQTLQSAFRAILTSVKSLRITE